VISRRPPKLAMFNPTYTEEQQALLETARKFTREEG
jgi:hypothetical protein